MELIGELGAIPPDGQPYGTAVNPLAKPLSMKTLLRPKEPPTGAII